MVFTIGGKSTTDGGFSNLVGHFLCIHLNSSIVELVHNHFSGTLPNILFRPSIRMGFFSIDAQIYPSLTDQDQLEVISL